MGARKPPPCVADDRIEAYMGNVIGFSFGLLLGHRAPTNLSDLILTVVTTPPEQEGARLTHLRDVSIEWMVLHAAQVLGYLPEGIDCVGLYVVAEDRAALRGLQLQRHMHALRHAVSSLKKTTLREAYDADCVQYVAVSCPGVPPSIKHFNKDNAMVLRDFKWQRDVAIMSLRRFTATIDVTSIVGRLPFRSASSLTARLHRELESAICLAASKTHVTFLRSLASAPCGRRDDKVGEVDTAQPVNLQSVQGNISCVAYVHHKAKNPVDVAGGRLGEDCVRSIARRLAMQQERATTDGGGASILELRVAYWIASGVRISPDQGHAVCTLTGGWLHRIVQAPNGGAASSSQVCMDAWWRSRRIRRHLARVGVARVARGLRRQCARRFGK
ncbi:hypothetical protein, variant 2 [Aphanomyces invadans]|uniref:Uncharacterized protein n=1 Tax=Aphanomyces invadans TaxID=157072 RepID=A0A024UU61_9STRA|nr:hypothetical protein, variant 2 [Aphanomyces invadans]ETW09442.1 hypothetical protein, variant 2 [Aphanomyces invadans]|eukprot:XP_008860854.1 hypothetical protein, variant 2 [Aphanomyces invadans]